MRGNTVRPVMVACCATTLLFALSSSPGTAQPRLSRAVVASGGTAASGGGVQLQGTIGQPVAGTAKGAAHAGFFGFWYDESNTVVAVTPTPLATATSPRIGTIYPNPAHDAVTVTVEAVPGQHADVLLVDLLGRVRARSELAAAPEGSATLRLSLSGLPPGIYHVMISGSAGSRALLIR